MRPTFDDFDAAILVARIAIWRKVTGPRVGDFVKMPDGSIRRFTHDWGDGLQTTVGDKHPCAGDASFYFTGHYMSFSGSLDSAVAKVLLVQTSEEREGDAWFFHHDEVKAHNRVNVRVLCRVYEVSEP